MPSLFMQEFIQALLGQGVFDQAISRAYAHASVVHLEHKINRDLHRMNLPGVIVESTIN